MVIDVQIVRTIPSGELFIHNDALYIRTDSNEYTAVNLQTGYLEKVSEDTRVVPIFGAYVRLS